MVLKVLSSAFVLFLFSTFTVSAQTDPDLNLFSLEELTLIESYLTPTVESFTCVCCDDAGCHSVASDMDLTGNVCGTKNGVDVYYNCAVDTKNDLRRTFGYSADL